VGRILVEQGTQVRANQPLLELETDYLRLELERAAAEKSRADAAAAEAGRDYERKKDLIAKGSVSQALYDRTRATFEQAEAGKAAAEAALALARQKLADATLVSPIEGLVVERRVDVGERLGESTVAFVVVQTAPLRLRFKLPERYLAVVHKEQRVRARVDPYPGEVFEGRVAVIVRAVDPASRTFLVEAEFPNRDQRLRPGLFARVELEVAS
jgi:membrane fusion protein (multidrug efflux system)